MASNPYPALAIFTALLAVSAARADTETLAKAGDWQAFGGTTNSGVPVCGVSTSPEDKYFGLKLFSGGKTFTVQISAKDWKITDKHKYPLTMRFDQRREWTATGTGMHFADGDPGLEYDINRQELDAFETEFDSSKILGIHFRTRGLKDWSLGLDGVKVVTDKFHDCNHDLH